MYVVISEGYFVILEVSLLFKKGQIGKVGEMLGFVLKNEIYFKYYKLFLVIIVFKRRC